MEIDHDKEGVSLDMTLDEAVAIALYLGGYRKDPSHPTVKDLRAALCNYATTSPEYAKAIAEAKQRPSQYADGHRLRVPERLALNTLDALNELWPPTLTLVEVNGGFEVQRSDAAPRGMALATFGRIKGRSRGNGPLRQRLETANWPSAWKPGERVLLLVAQGLRGVARDALAAEIGAIAERCTSDEDAMRIVASLQWNERADLPFPIRELLGIERDGSMDVESL